MKIAIALFNGCYASSFAGPQDIFHIANYFSRPAQTTPYPVFEVSLIARTGGEVRLAGGGKIAADIPGAPGGYDLIYVPSFPYLGEDELDRLMVDNQWLLEWLSTSWTQGAMLAASCTATFLLAQTGLLDHRRATTTWWLERQFRRRYPAVALDRQAILTSEDRLMCAGAMTSSLNLAIEIVAQQGSAELARKCARTMMIDTSRQVQPFLQGAILEGESNHPVVLRAQHWLQAHLREKIDLSRLAQHLGVSSRSLNRYFRKELGMTPLEYLQGLRIENAKLMLEKTHLPLSQIVSDVGYSDVRSFTALFQRQVGMKPSVFRAHVAAQ